MTTAILTPPPTPTSASLVRAHIAATLLGPALPEGHPPGNHPPLGQISLRPHQHDAVERLSLALDEFGGALLADAVGLGKTFVALAIASRARRPLIVAPAALRATWADALRRTELRIPLQGAERLSRAPTREHESPPAHDLVIVDEAHHFRNPRTRRYSALASLTRGARVLLLSATPVHNRRADLHALLALFLGSRAAELDDAARARVIVRRTHEALPTALPHVLPLRTITIPTCSTITDRILALPPPLPPSDGGVAGALVAHGLLRLWASSTGALRAGLRRRLTRAEALLAALDADHLLSRAELARWAIDDSTVQLGFPGLLGACPDDGARASEPAAARAAVRAHRDALRHLLAYLAPYDDAPRADALRTLRRRHAGQRIVAFSQLADTVMAYYAALRRDGGICALTAAGATVAGGHLGRDDALRRFAPRAHDAPEPPEAERITLLLSTDVASEGLTLTDAAVCVHLDLPWTPARLEQRVGRLARLGSPHPEIAVYAITPPASTQALDAAERALRAKARTARHTIGAVGADIPGATNGSDRSSDRGVEHDTARSPAESREALHRELARWARPALLHAHHSAADHPTPHVATVVALRGRSDDGEGSPCPLPAFLALVTLDDEPHLVAGALDGGPASDDPSLLLRVARLAGGACDAPATDPAHLASAVAAIRAWSARRRASAALGASGGDTARLHRQTLARLAAIVRDAPLHRRSAVAASAAAARRVLALPLGAAAEREVGRLAGTRMEDGEWLAAVAALGTSASGGATRRRPAARAEPDRDGQLLRALIVVVAPATGLAVPPAGAAPYQAP